MIIVKLQDIKSSGISKISAEKILNHYANRDAVLLSEIVHVIGVDETLLYIVKNVNEEDARPIIIEFARWCVFSVRSIVNSEVYCNISDPQKMHDIALEITRNRDNLYRNEVTYAAHAVMNYANALMSKTVTEAAHYAAEVETAAMLACSYENMINSINRNQ